MIFKKKSTPIAQGYRTYEERCPKKEKKDQKEKKSKKVDVCFGVYDYVRVKVEPTAEFPLDIKTTLMVTEDDMIEYREIQREMERKQKEE